MRGADHPQRGAEAAGGQGAGIAVGQQLLRAAVVLADQLDAELGHGQVGLAVAVVDADGLGFQGGQHVVAVLQTSQALAHAVQRPEQVDRGRPRGRQHGEVLLQRSPPVAAGGQPRARAEHHAVGGADADRRGAAHHHQTDRLGHPGGAVVAAPGFLERQHALIEQMQDAVMPVDCLDLFRRQQLLAHGEYLADT
ncbi:hypothetical protein D3C75_605630 [compost metagenome]